MDSGGGDVERDVVVPRRDAVVDGADGEGGPVPGRLLPAGVQPRLPLRHEALLEGVSRCVQVNALRVQRYVFNTTSFFCNNISEKCNRVDLLRLAADKVSSVSNGESNEVALGTGINFAQLLGAGPPPKERKPGDVVFVIN